MAEKRKKGRAANGEGSTPVERADGRWHSRVTYYDEEGARQRKDIYGRTSKECVRNKQKFQAEVAAGNLPRKDNQSVTQYITDWLATRRDLSQSTAVGYQAYLRNHIGNSKLGAKSLADVQRSDVRIFMAALTDKGLTNSTVRRVMGVVGAALRLAHGDGAIQRNPMHLAKLPPPGDPRLDTLTPTQVRQLWQSVKDHPLAALFVLAPTIACRLGELLALRWSAVVLDGPEPHVKIEASLSHERGKGFIFGPPKTKAGLRTIPLGPDQVAVLRAHRARQNSVRLKVGLLWEDNDLLFCTSDPRGPVSFGKPLYRHNVWRLWKRLSKKAGLPDLPFHALRHTALTEMAAAEINPETIRQIAGHADVRITLAWYTHPTQEMKRQAIDRLNSRYANAPDSTEEDSQGAGEDGDPGTVAGA